ncbi:hypothetical protein WJ58_26140 [Burkholderia ubonensis]|uniref:hypothetical protein n=1 Tax=Burkholderia ubonensis TaxID=101571 RepID=UPI000759BA16|nr:hypothetical protein [Burkholderia ubonensis]KVM48919.1 hypothetical protein WJ58_26140 [Burkholderia ubonensis]
MADNSKLYLKIDRSAAAKVAERANRRMPREAPIDVGDLGKSVHFLRGVGSRSAFALSSYYVLLAADIDGQNPCTIPHYPGKVLQSYLKFSSLNTFALACRKVFDHGKGLTGAGFGKHSDSTLRKHAKYWAELSQRPMEDAYSALHFLRTFFIKCAKTDTDLFKDGTTLGRRIGFVKQYADRVAAHLSLQDYEFDGLDLAHVVAALVLVGEIIRSFDMASESSSYFDQIDQAALDATQALFPNAPKIRLFENIKIEQQARACWKLGEEFGIQMLTEQLPYAIGKF